MNKSLPSGNAKPAASRVGSALVAVCAGLSLLTAPLHAGLKPANVDNGLDALIEANLKLQAAKKDGTESSLKLYDGYATKKAGNMSHIVIKDGDSRILVRVQPNGVVPIQKIEKRAKKEVPAMRIQATDYKYHGAGVFEAWVPLDDVPKLCGLEGVSHVSLTPKPFHNKLMMKLSDRVAAAGKAQPDAVNGEVLNIIGTVFDFGITQHRVDQINQSYNPSAPVNYDGTGMSIGDLSDSFDTSTTASTNYADDATSKDLPGAGNTVNPTPVFVLEDYPGGTDEGRGMCQTLYKMAPKAKLAFATADYGEIEFANNIRSLANMPGYTNTANFAADVICDDVSYLDEPFFQDGIIAAGVNDVVNYGVTYCSSAANNSGTNGYDSDFRFVPNGTGLTAATNSALVGTNINLANVPAAAYAGGFHNFNPNGLDVAQTVNYPGTATLSLYGEPTGVIYTILQWNDPTDSTTPPISANPIFTDTGTIYYTIATEKATTVSFTHSLVAGQEYYLYLNPSSTAATPGTSPLDGQITVTDPNGNEISFTDNNGSGVEENTLFFAPIAGTYTFTISAFEEPTAGYITSGAFTLYTYTASGTQEVTQDLNLLVFDMNGNYISADSSVQNSIANNTPLEFVGFNAGSASQVQFVISKSNKTPNVTAGAMATGFVANHLRYLCFGDGINPLGPAEYFSYTTPLTFGHSCAAGANGVAAYPYYKPNIPEYFTSPGPSTQYFDENNNYIGKQVRLKPDVAAMDGANTTFFGSDDDEDEDSNPNFFGTSDACPHAGAIAALVLEAHGGPRSLTPAQVKSALQASAFPHDLDPYYAKGTARTTDGGKVTVIVKGDDENATTATQGANGTEGIQDPNAFTIQYEGPGSLTSFVFNSSGAVATAGNVTDGINGISDASPYEYFVNSTPGMVFNTSPTSGAAFTAGTSVPSSLAAEATAAESNPEAGATIPGSLNFTLTLTFPSGDFVGGDVFRFGIGRAEYESSYVATSGNPPADSDDTITNGSADLFGGGVTIPDGSIDTQVGMAFSGTTSTGATFGTSSPGLTSQTAFIRNRIGYGYSPLDGFGFIDAQTACGQPFGDHGTTALKEQPGTAR
jgi:hypothetical protein